MPNAFLCGYLFYSVILAAFSYAFLASNQAAIKRKLGYLLTCV